MSVRISDPVASLETMHTADDAQTQPQGPRFEDFPSLKELPDTKKICSARAQKPRRPCDTQFLSLSE